MHVRIEQKVEREEVAKVTGTNKDESVVKAPVRRAIKKVQPNDPCPCGSGRKYKYCHGRIISKLIMFNRNTCLDENKKYKMKRKR